MTEVIRCATARLAEAGIERPHLDAEVMAGAAIGISREKLLTFAGEMSPTAARVFAEFIARRIAREPVAYIIGHKEFFSLDFEVNPSVLIPRPESEVLAAAALRWIKDRGDSCRVLELCTGCGAIAIAIAANCTAARIIATDISREALLLAQRNAERHRVADQIGFQCRDLWPKAEGDENLFDLIVANPPYISAPEMATLEPDVIQFEPRTALDGGLDGLRFYRSIAQRARGFLRPRGRLMVEIGAGRRAAVGDILASYGATDFATISDLARVQRVIGASFVPECR